jgi:predicted DNA-binding transcriptional regulator YafY
MNDESLKKFNRIITILIQLQSKKVVKASDLAERFDVSLRTIYRDIQALEKAGVPVIGEPGLGYSIMEGYRLPPVMFSREEAMSFVTAEKLMLQLSDKGIGRHYESAMTKIKSVLRSTQKEMLEGVSSNIAVHARKDQAPSTVPNALELVLECIVSQKQLRMQYRAFSDSETERVIEPVGIFYEYSSWYILGYCLLREDYRQFRTDRILSMQITEQPFSREHGKLEEHRREYADCEKEKVVIVVDRNTAKYIAQAKLHYGFVSQREVADGIEMTFMIGDVENHFARWMMMFADKATVIAPEILNTYLLKLTHNIQQRHAKAGA